MFQGAAKSLDSPPVSEFVTATYRWRQRKPIRSIHNPAFTDNFATPHNYLVNGLPGTGWESLFQSEGDQPQENDGGDGPEITVTNDASITTPGVLTIAAKDTTWVGAANNGFLLAKYVQGDFQAAVHVHGLQRTVSGTGIANEFAGLMARAYNASGVAGQEGGPSTLNIPPSGKLGLLRLSLAITAFPPSPVTLRTETTPNSATATATRLRQLLAAHDSQ